MTLEDIKKDVVVWVKWEYSIMGRDTGVNDGYFIIQDVQESNDLYENRGKKYKQIKCQAKSIGSDKIQKFSLNDWDIEIGWLRLVKLNEIKILQIQEQADIEKEISELKTKISILEIKKTGLDDKYSEFIKKANDNKSA